MGAQTRYIVQRIKRRCRSTLVDSGRWLVSTIPVDFEELLMWDHLHWFPYLISFPSIRGSSKTEPEHARVTSFMTEWFWNPRWARIWFGPPPWWLEPDEFRTSFSVRTPSLISASSISKHGRMHGAHVFITWPPATFLLTTISLIAKIRKQSILDRMAAQHITYIYTRIYMMGMLNIDQLLNKSRETSQCNNKSTRN